MLHARTKFLTNPHFHSAPGFFHPNTRTHVRLLGPCFKTGRKTPFSHRHLLAETASSVSARAALHSPKNFELCRSPPHRNPRWPPLPARYSAPLQTALGQPTGTLTSSASPSAVSGPLSLSFQSSLHLSLTVLLRYRSLAHI